MKGKNIKGNKIFLNIFIIVFIIFLLINIYVIISKPVFGTTLPQMFGYSYVIDETENMTPTLNIGDMVLFKSANEYNVDDVVLVNQNGEIAITRVIAKDESGYTLKGDNERAFSVNLIDTESFQGKMVFSIPNGEQIIIYISVAVIVVLILYNVIKVKRQERLIKRSHDIKRLKKTARFKRNFIPDIIAISLVVTTVMSISSARYVSSASGWDTVGIANIYMEPDYSQLVEIDLGKVSPADKILGTDNSIGFIINISNHTDLVTSDVIQDYNIRLETVGNIPVTYHIEPVIDTTSAPNQTYVSNFVKSTSGKEYIAEGGELPNTTPVIHSYKITIVWNDGMYDAKYSKEVDYIKLYIDSVQKD